MIVIFQTTALTALANIALVLSPNLQKKKLLLLELCGHSSFAIILWSLLGNLFLCGSVSYIFPSSNKEAMNRDRPRFFDQVGHQTTHTT